MVRQGGGWSRFLAEALLGVALGLAPPARGQTIVTVAGGGTDDGLEAVQAEVDSPLSLAFDAAGNLYIAESGRIRRVSATTRTISTVSTAVGGQIAFSPSGTLYAVSGLGRLYTVDVASGTARLVTVRGHNGLAGIAIDRDGSLYLGDDGRYVKKLDPRTGDVTTVAGNGTQGFSGDGGPATAAALRLPGELAIDSKGALFISDRGNDRIRRVDPVTGVITTVAGGGFGGDDGPATRARLDIPFDVELDADGNLLLCDGDNHRVRRVDAATGTITTLAGSGAAGSDGDGGPATAATLDRPRGLALDMAGNVYIADSERNRVRRVEAATGIISTAAGTGATSYVGDGLEAAAARLSFPFGVTVDSAGNLYIAEDLRVRRVDGATGLISTVARISCVSATALDPSERFLYVADRCDGRVRRLDLQSGAGVIVAGNGKARIGDPPAPSTGNGGPATEAPLNQPYDIAVDGAGDLYIADTFNYAVRRVDGKTGIISTVAGPLDVFRPTAVEPGPSGSLYVASERNVVYRLDLASREVVVVAGIGGGFSGDGGPATQARLGAPSGLAVDPGGNLLIAEADNHRVRRVDAATGIITTVVSGGRGSAGDLGPATAARLDSPRGLASSTFGDLFIADFQNHRVRAVHACRVGAFSLTAPPDGATVDPEAVHLAWTKADSAFHYDVIVDTAFPPARVERGDVTGTQTSLGRLAPGTTYFWQVRARGDPLCSPVPGRASSVRRFVTGSRCAPPPPPSPIGNSVSGTTAVLTFSGVADAGSYDVYIGSGPSPPLAASGVTSPSYTIGGLSPGTTYRWRVVARAACDPGLASSSAESALTMPGACPAPAAVSLLPVSSSTTPVLSWVPAGGAATYDLYLGPEESPPLVASGLSAPHFPSVLSPGTVYRWRVVARAACDASRITSSETGSFTTPSACAAPGRVGEVTSTKRSAQAGTLYVLSWPPVPGLPPGGAYRVERARSADFSSGLETVVVAGTSASLPADVAATYSHRVAAVSPCGTTSTPGPASEPVTVTVTAAPPVIAMTRPPRAIVIRQPGAGQPLPSLEVELRNVGGSDFVGFFTSSQPLPFFQMSENVVSLRPGEIRVFFLRFTGVPGDQPGAYDGTLSIASADPNDKAAYPQASVSLVITGTRPGDPEPPGLAAPLLLAADTGKPLASMSFAPTPAGQAPPELVLDVRNAGTAPLYPGADTSPEPWVAPARGWNAQPILPGATRSVRLAADRSLGEGAGGFPHATYVTFRTSGGQSARLSVDDSDVVPAGPCPGRSALGPGETSLIVPSLVNAPALNGSYVSRLLITNLGPDPAQAELFYTPDGADGFDCERVLSATVVIPGADVFAFTDPVGRLFRTHGSGQLEVRSSLLGQLRVQSVVDAPAPGGGSFGFQLPAVKSGDGARQGRPYAVIGIVQNAAYRTNVILAETRGQRSAVTLTLSDRAGKTLGTARRELAPYGKTQLSVAEVAPGVELDAGALEIAAIDGSAGSVMAVTTVIDNLSADASSFVGRPLTADTASTSYAVASVVYTSTFRSRLEIRNNGSREATYHLIYRGSTGTVESARRTLAPRQEDAFDNLLLDVFGLPAGTFGPLAITSDSPNLQVVSRVYAPTPAGSDGAPLRGSPGPSGTYGDAIEGVALDDPRSTGDSGRVLSTDGLEGTADGDRSRGARTNLILTEVAGGTVELEVSLWEKTKARSAPVARRAYTLGPYRQVQLNDVFATLGIGQKDRQSVLCQLRPAPGATGRVLALATRIDNVTNDTKNLALVP